MSGIHRRFPMHARFSTPFQTLFLLNNSTLSSAPPLPIPLFSSSPSQSLINTSRQAILQQSRIHRQIPRLLHQPLSHPLSRALITTKLSRCENLVLAVTAQNGPQHEIGHVAENGLWECSEFVGCVADQVAVAAGAEGQDVELFNDLDGFC